MRVSAKAEYACVAVLELAAHHGSRLPVSVKAIAEQHDIPQRYLVQILLQLKGAGYVASTRGTSGGYQLVVSPEEISLADVMTAIDGPLPDQYKPASARNSPATQAIASVWNEVLDAERDALQEVTFAELVKRMKKSVENMYYI
jgi:Rrf2 family transcriptional regulator, cysteine metabolism repressor